MKSYFKKLIYITLALMSLTGISYGVYALANDPDGSAERPYEISTIEEFKAFIEGIRSADTEVISKHFIQTVDIDATGSEITGLTTSNEFTGVYDGRGHVIKNINVTSPNGALFGVLGINGVIRNFGLEGGTIKHTSGSFAGGLVRVLRGGTIENVYMTSNVISTSTTVQYLSGLVAYLDGNGTISNCYFDGNLSADATTFKDKAGIAYGKVSNGTSISINNSYAVDTSINLVYSEISAYVYNSSLLTIEDFSSNQLVNNLNNSAVLSSNSLYKWKILENGLYPTFDNVFLY